MVTRNDCAFIWLKTSLIVLHIITLISAIVLLSMSILGFQMFGALAVIVVTGFFISLVFITIGLVATVLEIQCLMITWVAIDVIICITSLSFQCWYLFAFSIFYAFLSGTCAFMLTNMENPYAIY